MTHPIDTDVVIEHRYGRLDPPALAEPRPGVAVSPS
jgi:hypothetical protein